MSRLSTLVFLAAVCACAAPAQAAPYTLKLNGTFSATSSTNAWTEQFAQLVWGSAGWTNGRTAALAWEIDFDDALTATALNGTQSSFAHETITALRLTLGGVQLATTGAAPASKIDFGLRDNTDVPSLLDGDGFSLLLGQQWTRDSTGAYTLPGAQTVVSPNGQYYYAFSVQQTVGVYPALEVRAYSAATNKLVGTSPTGRVLTTGWSVAPADDGPTTPPTGQVPEPASLLLSGLALAVLAALRVRRA
ncbi:MAG: PEP-CTERM sorting domain-containing protein [Rubrivivax sp.]|jgi:hypothetical protein